MPLCGIAVALGDEAARIGLVARRPKIPCAATAPRRRRRFAACSSSRIGRRARNRASSDLPSHRRRHRMPIDEKRDAEGRARARCSSRRSPVWNGLCSVSMRSKASVTGNAPPIDVLPVGDDARNGAEPGRDAHRACIGEAGKRPLDQARIELVGLAVDVEIGARKAGMDERNAALGRGRQQEIDEGILGAPELEGVEARARRKGSG